MFKKNSWIAAMLLLAVVFVFTGCIDALETEADDMTYTEVPLGDFNAWAGQVYQKGWAVAGIKFKGIGDKAEVAADKGYKNDDFVKARFLVIEMPEGVKPDSSVQIIWGGEDASGSAASLSDWNQAALKYGASSIVEGNVLTIDLTKALLNYPKYKTAAKTKIIIQSPNTLPEKLIKKAYLLVPDKIPFVAVSDMKLKANKFTWTTELALEGEFTPEDATNQIVKWSIKSWTPPNGIGTLSLPQYPEGQGTDSSKDDYNPNYTTELLAYNTAKAALLAKVNFKPKTLVIRPAVDEIKQDKFEIWDWTVQPPQLITVPSDNEVLQEAVPEFSKAWHEDNIIVATDGVDSKGTVVVIATVVNGISEPVGEEGKAGYKAGVNLVKEFTVTIIDPNAFTYKVDGTSKTTVFWGGMANSGATSEMVVPTNNASKYTITMEGNMYGNAYHYVKYDLGSGKKLSDYEGLTFKYKGVSGDINYKDIHVQVLDAAPGSTYNPGKQVSELNTGNVGSGGVTMTAVFGESKGAADAGFASNVTTADGYGQYVYLWFVPWSDGKKTVFEISDVEFLTTIPVTP